MSRMLLNQALAMFPAPRSKKFSLEWWQNMFEQLFLFLSDRTEEERKTMYMMAKDPEFQQNLKGFSGKYLWFFLHPTFEVFEAFWQDSSMRGYFAEHLRVLLRHSYDAAPPSGRQFKKKMKQLKTAHFTYPYIKLLARHFPLFCLDNERAFHGKYWADGIRLLTKECIPSPESVEQIFKKEERLAMLRIQGDFQRHIERLHAHKAEYIKVFGGTLNEKPEIDNSVTTENLMSSLEVSEFVLEIPRGIRSIHELTRTLSGILRRGSWPTFRIIDEPMVVHASRAKVVRSQPNITIIKDVEERYFELIHRVRGISQGRLSIGLKIHCANREARGVDYLQTGCFTAHNADTCFNIMPVGGVEQVAQLFRRIEEKSGVCFLNNPEFQIQVCSPGEITPRHAAILGIAFYLGSDQLRTYHPGDFRTSHSGMTGDRLIIYGAGVLDEEFEWWGKHGSSLNRLPSFPREIERKRTDVLGCRSLIDIENVNLVATLLVHAQHGGYWEGLGRKFVEEMEQLLSKHQLLHLLNTNWVKEKNKGTYPSVDSDDAAFYQALEELSTYAFEEAARIARAYEQEKWTEVRTGILFEVKDLLDEYRSEMAFLATQALEANE